MLSSVLMTHLGSRAGASGKSLELPLGETVIITLEAAQGFFKTGASDIKPQGVCRHRSEEEVGGTLGAPDTAIKMSFSAFSHMSYRRTSEMGG